MKHFIFVHGPKSAFWSILDVHIMVMYLDRMWSTVCTKLTLTM